MAIISVIGIGYLKPHIYAFDDFLVAFSRPLSDPPSNDFLHSSLFGLSVFLLYSNITIPTGLIAARFSIVCTNSGLNKNFIFRILGLCITLTIIQAVGITFPFSEHISSDIKIDAIKKYNIESDILTESTAVLGRKIVVVWIIVNEDIPENILSDWIKKNNISLIGISESTEAIAFNLGSMLSYIVYALLISIFSVTYIIIILYVKKYRKYIASYSSIMSNNTLIINRQFMMILIFQSSVPVIVTGIPIIIFFIMIITENTKTLSTFGILLVNLLMLVPCINPILFLGLSSRNRKYLCFHFKKFTNCLLCKKENAGLVNTFKSQSKMTT
uniref:G_PROTEIN_RECEP_F1_2 domain-containing protein n=1 Tax=Strongyloides papillosus TaxID=174720 RepID=A0A0N5BIK5_STREA